MVRLLSILGGTLSAIGLVSSVSDIGTVGSVTSQTVIQKLESGSELVALYSEPAYTDPIYVLSLHGEKSYDQGYDAGVLMGVQSAENYQVVLSCTYKMALTYYRISWMAFTAIIPNWNPHWWL